MVRDDAETDVDPAINLLNGYFEPKVNLTFEAYSFRQMKQDSSESVTQYSTRLKEAAKRCQFHDTDREVKDQIVFTCISDQLRRKALREDYNLQSFDRPQHRH